MPGQDRTGPLGQGPLTGRGLGPCGRGLGRGFGRGLGIGFGRGFGFQRQVITEKEEGILLEEEKQALKQELEDIEKRLKELKG